MGFLSGDGTNWFLVLKGKYLDISYSLLESIITVVNLPLLLKIITGVNFDYSIKVLNN